MGSGVGLVLQLFSCLTGDESAMELWLLLSSSKDRETESQLLFWLEFWIPFLCKKLCENTSNSFRKKTKQKQGGFFVIPLAVGVSK